MSIEDDVKEFRGRLPRVTPEQAREYARDLYDDHEDVSEFLRIWDVIEKGQATIRQAKFKNDVNRLMGED